MCGIAGIVTRDGSSPSEDLLRRMSDAIAHRGPDGQGAWTAPGVGLAHRRLAIIDVSPDASQPMHDVSGRFTITFNGEIYNYRELRSELESRGATFRTHSDTEVILEAYRAWGVESLKRLRGMFAFAMWDSETRRLTLARDTVGKKPLFYCVTTDGGLAFASELKALSHVTTLRPDWNAVRLFLGLQYVPSPLTGFDGVKQLLPGEIGVFDEKGWRTEKYHEYSCHSREDGNPECESPFTLDPRLRGDDRKANIDETIRQKLEDAVRIRQLASDVPVGAFLSGGIDSAAVVAFASRHVSRPLQTYTMGFPSLHLDERREAQAIAKQFKTDHHEFEARPEHLMELVDELVTHYDAPYADSSALPLWLLARETAKDIKVVLTGDGGDELFGGYRRYGAYETALALSKIPCAAGLASLASRVSSSPRFRRFAETLSTVRNDPSRAYGELFCGSYFSTAALRGTFDPAFLARTETSDAVDFVTTRIASSERARQAVPLQQAMRFDFTSYLPDDLNVKMDRATMRFGLEARSPFLDQDVAAYALGLPIQEKAHHGKTKIALKRALAGTLPDDVLNRTKRGFQVPLAEWFRGPLAGLLTSRLLDPSLPISRILDRGAVGRLIDENSRGVDHGNRLWMLLSLSTWLSKHGT